MEEGLSKGRDGAVAGTHSDRDFKAKMFASGEETCPVDWNRRVYRQRRPEPMLDKTSPFYLQPSVNPKGEIWYKNQRLGINSLGKQFKGNGRESWFKRRENCKKSPRSKNYAEWLVRSKRANGYRIISCLDINEWTPVSAVWTSTSRLNRRISQDYKH